MNQSVDSDSMRSPIYSIRASTRWAITLSVIPNQLSWSDSGGGGGEIPHSGANLTLTNSVCLHQLGSSQFHL